MDNLPNGKSDFLTKPRTGIELLSVALVVYKGAR